MFLFGIRCVVRRTTLIAFAPPPDFEAAEGAARETGRDATLGERGAAVDERGRLLGAQDVLEGTGNNEAIAARAEMHTELIAAFNSNSGNVLTAYFSSLYGGREKLAERTSRLYAQKLGDRMREIAVNAKGTLMIQFGVSEESGPVVLAADPFVLDRMIKTLGRSSQPWERPLLGALQDYKNSQQAARNATINPNSLESLVSAKNADWIRLNPEKLEKAATNAVIAKPSSIAYLSKYADLWRVDPEAVYARIVKAAIDAGKVDVIFYASKDWKKINTDAYRSLCVEASETQDAVRILQLISGDEFAAYWKQSLKNTAGIAGGAYVDVTINALKANPTLAFTLIHEDLKRMGVPFYRAVVRDAPNAVPVLFENTPTTAFKDYEFTTDAGVKYRGFEAALREIAGLDTAKAVITIFGNPSLLATVRSKSPLFYKELFDTIVKFDDDEIMTFIERHGIVDEDFIEKFVVAMFANKDAWIATYPNLMRTVPEAMYAEPGVRAKLLEIFQVKGQLLSYAPFAVRNDKDFVLQVVRVNANAFAQASLGLRDDADVLLAAVKAEEKGKGNVHWADIGPTLRIKLGNTPLEGGELLRRVLGLPEDKPELTAATVNSGLDNFEPDDLKNARMVLAYLATPGARNKPTYIVDADPLLKKDPVFIAQALRIDPRYFLYLGSEAHEALKGDVNYKTWFKKVLEIDLAALKAVPTSVLTPALIVEMTPKDTAKRIAYFRAIPEIKLGDIEFANAVVKALTSRGQQAVDEFIAVLPEAVRSAILVDFTQITPDKLPNEMYNAALIKKITNIYEMDNVDAAAFEMMTTWVAYAVGINKNLYAEVPVKLRNDPAFVVAMLQKTFDATLVFSKLADPTLVHPALFDALVASSAKSSNLLNLRVALRSASPALRTQFVQQCVGHDGFPDMFAYAGNIDLIPDNAIDQNIFNHIVGTYPHRELFEKAGKKPEGIAWIVAYLKINPALWSVVQTCDSALVDKVRKSMTPAELSQDAQKANETTLSIANHRSNIEGFKNYALWMEVLGLIEIGRSQDIVLPPHGDHAGNIRVFDAYNYLARKAQQRNGVLPQREIEQLRDLIRARINVSAVTETELQTRAPKENTDFLRQLGYIKTLKSMLWSLNVNTRASTDKFIRDRVSAQFNRLASIAEPRNLALEIDLTLEAISGYDTWGLNAAGKQFYKDIESRLLEMRKNTWEKITVPGKPVIQRKEPPPPEILEMPEVEPDVPLPPADPVVKGGGTEDEEVDIEDDTADADTGPRQESLLDEFVRAEEVARQSEWKNVQKAVLEISRSEPNSKAYLRECMAVLEKRLADVPEPKKALEHMNTAREYGPITDRDGMVFVLEWAEDLSGGHLELKKS